jgi:hypothetical protein
MRINCHRPLLRPTALARRVLTGTHRPIISVDWFNLDEGKRRYLLRSSVAVAGRSFTLYEQVHSREQFMKAVMERRFLCVTIRVGIRCVTQHMNRAC